MKNTLPNKKGYFREFGGRFVPETLVFALQELEGSYLRIKNNQDFQRELNYYLKEFAGRPTPLYFARNLSRLIKAKVYLKREDLLHTGAHKINNTLGQILLARYMKKTRIIAETGAGQHGVATATVAALFNMPCFIYMGQEDIQRQKINVFRMKLLGAKIIAVNTGAKTLKEAVSEAIRDWVTNVKNTYYILGSVVGPHPYPMIVRDFQTIIGRETKSQLLKEERRLPDYLIACVGGGSNSIGLFYPFFDCQNTKFIGVEAAGEGLNSLRHAASLLRGRIGILHGMKSYILQDKNGQIKIAHSIAAGLDYPGVGPEHAYYKQIGRAEYVAIKDKEAIEGFRILSETEGIIPALEPAHAIAYVYKKRQRFKGNLIVICLSGRGDKDIDLLSKSSLL